MENNQAQTQKTPFASIVDKYDNYFFDCDGVLYNGSHFLKEAFIALNKLKELGKNVFFVTNTSKNSRKTTETNLRKGGFEPDVDKIFTSSYLAARYLRLMHPDVKKVYLIGLDGLKSELEMENITVVGGHEHTKKPMDGKIFDELEVEEDIGAVVVGVDYEFNYYKLAYASVLLQKGALFVAANFDSSIKMQKYKMPGAGCMVRALEHASGRESHLVGKPCADVIEVATKDFGLDLKRCLMIGDRLDSDIMVGKNAGIDTFAVLTGCTSEQELLEEIAREDGVKPTYYWDRVEI